MASPTPPAAAEPLVWLTIEQAAARVHLSIRSLERYEHAGKLVPHKLPGGGKRYRPADIDALLTLPAPAAAED